MSIYLVDYENVNADGFRGVEKLSKDDSVYVFYTTNAGNLSFDVHKKLIESASEIKYFSVASGKNALDFQLTMFAGYLLGKGISQNIYIISNDKGFDANILFYDTYLSADGIDVVRHTSIASTYVTKEKPSSVKIVKSNNYEKSDSLYNSLCAIFPNYSSCDIINISAIFHGTTDKKEFHRELVTRFKQEKGMEIYSVLKSEFLELKNAHSNSSSKLSSLLKGYESSEITAISEILKNSTGKQNFYVTLVAKFGQEKGSEVYNLLKSEYTNLKKTA